MRLKKKFIIIFMIICIIALLFSSYKIIKWKVYSNNIAKQTTKIQEKVTIVESNEDAIIIEQEKEVPKSNPYWDFIGYNLINVDFKSLKSINNNVKGWIQIMGTIINYPFVQTTDNSYYLYHSFDKNYNEAGWIFMDYRNKENDKNIILYGHSRYDNSMFGSLKNVLKNGWLDNTKNHVIKLSTENENTLWQVFSIYTIPETSDYLEINFNNDENFIKFSDMIKKRSIHDFKTDISASDTILTLSTCYKINDRIVLHAKLIKKEVRTV